MPVRGDADARVTLRARRTRERLVDLRDRTWARLSAYGADVAESHQDYLAICHAIELIDAAERQEC